MKDIPSLKEASWKLDRIQKHKEALNRLSMSILTLTQTIKVTDTNLQDNVSKFFKFIDYIKRVESLGS